ncbi:MAG: DUF1684 domain-containing protein [Candidatus Latescibacteria bacterium]|nr:DUF1684 domain-containing protein [Candidatus Latescibacterota bacterium]
MRLPLLAILASCAVLVYTGATPAQEASALLIEDIQAGRALKDSLLRHGADSPIPQTERAVFAGLNYFSVDLAYRIAGQMHIYGRRQQIQLPNTGDSFTPVERWGRFVGELAGTPFWLEIYRSGDSDELVIFYTDPTNGEESYGGGRYVALQRQEDGGYVLDFNLSYNPYCVYNTDYICPIPPAHNRMPMAIRAGEMGYKGELAH